MTINQSWPDFTNDFIHLYGRDKSTAKHYTTAKNSFVKAVGDLEIDSVTPLHVTKWSKAARLSNNTKNVYMDGLATFNKWCLKRHLTEIDWFDGVKRADPEEPVPKALTWEEAWVVADNCWGKRLSIRDRMLVLFLFHTGARVSEAVHYPIHAVDLTENKVIFTDTKGKVARLIYFGPKFRAELDQYLTWRAGWFPESYWLFPSRSGDALTEENVQDMFMNYKLGVTPHQMRHTFLTQALKKTNDLKLVQELAGHKSILTTSRYLRIWDSEKKAAALSIEGEEGGRAKTARRLRKGPRQP